jgi:inosine-uridine nucleoside N-ribohydrolase
MVKSGIQRWLMMCGVAGLLASSGWGAEPVKLIFDTDMGNDVDDVMALGMIHALEARGAVKLLAVTVTKDHALAGPFVDVINTFYGKGETLIGVVKDGATKEKGRFNGLAEEKNADGSLRYPHDLMSSADAPEATGLIRKLLAQEADGSVMLVQVGFFTNFARVLASGPDEHSPLSGRDLLKAKCKSLVMMAGTFQTVEWNTRHLEYNVVKDVPAAQKLVAEWPTDIVWSGYEIGVAAAFQHQVIEQDLNYVPHHPLKESYYLYEPPPHDRPTWDPTALLYAVYPDRGYFSLSPRGWVKVEDNGATWFTRDKKDQAKHRFLLMDAGQTEKVREAVIQLSVAPPSGLVGSQ